MIALNFALCLIYGEQMILKSCRNTVAEIRGVLGQVRKVIEIRFESKFGTVCEGSHKEKSRYFSLP